MFDPQMSLLSTVLASVARDLAANAADEQAWARASEALAPTRAHESELAQIVEARDAARLTELVAQWGSGKRHLPEQDREVLKRAMTAFRKSLKVTRMDDESTLGGRGMTSGRQSAIAGITPPHRYPREVWEELARQKRLVAGRQGTYELPPGG